MSAVLADLPDTETTVVALLAMGGRRLTGLETGRLDAELLLGHVLDCTRSALFSRSTEVVSRPRVAAFTKLLGKRAGGMPVAYLLGRREFWSLELRVTPDTLIPRPETELLVELALAAGRAEDDLRVVDLGTGGGAIALAIASERPRWTLFATDVSSEALAVALDNAGRLGLANVTFGQGDWCTPLAGECYDAVVSNPPYIAAGDPHLGKCDVRFEPTQALVGGACGLQALREIIHGAGAHLRPRGWLMLEHGATQAEAVREMMRAQRYGVIATHRDLAGLERVTVGRRGTHP
ncbi:MAG: peptide chain release factor N(5)-glutamine methyltransferase [Chromatiales bacterium]